MDADPCLDFDWDAFLKQDFNSTFHAEQQSDGSNCGFVVVEDMLECDAFALTGDFPDAHLQPLLPGGGTAGETDSKETPPIPDDQTAATREMPAECGDQYGLAPNQMWRSSMTENVLAPMAECSRLSPHQSAAEMQQGSAEEGNESSDWIVEGLDIGAQLNQLRNE